MLRATLPKTVELNENLLSENIYIFGNATQMSQLVMNLCVNAQDAIEGGRGKIDISMEKRAIETIKLPDVLRDELPVSKDTPYVRLEDLEAGRTKLVLGHLSKSYQYVVLSVRDDGSGMSRIIMEHIFEPFFTTKAPDKGTGLGMATVLGIVASHQGMMVIDSALGKGTCFDLYFPLLDNAEEIELEEDIIDLSNTKVLRDEEIKHILLVEDQENVRNMITEMITRLGHDISCAETGLAGLDMVRENPDLYDLVITDHNMPKMTGLEMAQQVHLDIR